jgi:hypothetical protein
MYRVELSGFSGDAAAAHYVLLPEIPQMTPELGQIVAVFRPSGKIEARFGQLPSPRTARTVIEGLIW